MSKNTPKTELIYQKSKPIDHLSLFDGLSLMIKEQKNAALQAPHSAAAAVPEKLKGD